jgi:hypothetical protein
MERGALRAKWSSRYKRTGKGEDTFFLFNLVGLPTYPSWYDRFLLAVSLGSNGLTVWYAWRWV